MLHAYEKSAANLQGVMPSMLIFFSCFSPVTWRLMSPISLASRRWWLLPRKGTPGGLYSFSPFSEGLWPLPKTPVTVGMEGKRCWMNPISFLFPKLCPVRAEQNLSCFSHKVIGRAWECVKMCTCMVRKRGSHLIKLCSIFYRSWENWVLEFEFL